MKIIIYDLAGYDTVGGCEKYLSILADHFSINNKVTFLSSKHFVFFLRCFYFVLTLGKSKFSPAQTTKRNIGKTSLGEVTIMSLIPFFPQNKRIKKLLRSADIIYAKNEFQDLFTLYYLLGKKQYSQKVIVGTHTAIFVPTVAVSLWKTIHDLLYNGFLYKKFLVYAKLIHVPNSDYINMISDFYGVNKEKIVYIPYFIDWKTNLVNKKEINKFRILWAGRISEQKGLDRLKNIIDLLSKYKSFEDMEIVIAGHGGIDFVNELKGKYKNINHLGLVSDMYNLYQSIDICMVTSYWETFGYNALEPQSFGLPVISFEIAGPRDIIINDKTGYLVKNEKDFVDKIIKLYENSRVNNNIFYKMKKYAYDNSNSEFSKDNIFIKLETKLFAKINND
jgi:glycosyltransferase involved in cell wall biosynthesis